MEKWGKLACSSGIPFINESLATCRTLSRLNIFPQSSITKIQLSRLTVKSSTSPTGKCIQSYSRDTAGQEEYSKLRPIAYSHTDIFLIVLDVTEQNSFVNAKKKVIDMLIYW